MKDTEAKELGFTAEHKTDSLSGYSYYEYSMVVGSSRYLIVDQFEGPYPVVIYKNSTIPHVYNLTYGEQIFKGKVRDGELKLLCEQLGIIKPIKN
jgi:hypothetical protein